MYVRHQHYTIQFTKIGFTNLLRSELENTKVLLAWKRLLLLGEGGRVMKLNKFFCLSLLHRIWFHGNKQLSNSLDFSRINLDGSDVEVILLLCFRDYFMYGGLCYKKTAA